MWPRPRSSRPGMVYEPWVIPGAIHAHGAREHVPVQGQVSRPLNCVPATRQARAGRRRHKPEELLTQPGELQVRVWDPQPRVRGRPANPERAQGRRRQPPAGSAPVPWPGPSPGRPAGPPPARLLRPPPRLSAPTAAGSRPRSDARRPGVARSRSPIASVTCVRRPPEPCQPRPLQGVRVLDGARGLAVGTTPPKG